MSGNSFVWRRIQLGWIAMGTSIVLAVSCTPMPDEGGPPTVPMAADENAAPAARHDAFESLSKADADVVVDKATVLAAQRALLALGYDIGEADGITGPATRQAVLSFQKDHGLGDDGRLTLPLVRRLKSLADNVSGGAEITVHSGDMLVYSDGEVEIASTAHKVEWRKENFSGKPGRRVLIAIRPPMQGWPVAARNGLDWALTHALESPASSRPVKWSSTGVAQQFEIRAFASSQERADSGGGAVCRMFEMQTRKPTRRYPGIACRDISGSWYIPHSTIWLARPASALNHPGIDSGGDAN